MAAASTPDAGGASDIFAIMEPMAPRTGDGARGEAAAVEAADAAASKGSSEDAETAGILHRMASMCRVHPSLVHAIVHLHNSQNLWRYVGMLEESGGGSEQDKELRQKSFDSLGRAERELLEQVYVARGSLTVRDVANAQLNPPQSDGSSSTDSSSPSSQANQRCKMGDSFRRMVLNRLDFLFRNGETDRASPLDPASSTLDLAKVLNRFDGFLDRQGLIEAIDESTFAVRGDKVVRIE